MAKILILGETNTQWIEECIKYSEVYKDNQIVIYSTTKTSHEEFFTNNRIKVYQFQKSTGIISKIPKLRTLELVKDYVKGIKRIIHDYGDFDIVHATYLRKEKVFSLKYIRKHTKKIVCTFWGSDLLREKDNQLEQYASFFSYVDCIMISTEKMFESFVNIYGHKYDNKICKLRFGVSALEQIETNKANNIAARLLYGILPDKCCITIGYNGGIAQQHMKVLEALKKTIVKNRDRLFILIPFTYGGDEPYKKTIENTLIEFGCEYRIVDCFLNEKELAMLRMATDIFIHCQISDAFSASVQEYLYAGKLVLNPSWIQYKELQQSEVFYFEYGSFEKLNSIVTYYLEKGINPDEKEQLEKNQKKIWDLSSWEAVKAGWQKIYSV